MNSKKKFSNFIFKPRDQIFFDDQKDVIYTIESVKRDFFIACVGDQKIKCVNIFANIGIKLNHDFFIFKLAKNKELPSKFLFAANTITKVNKNE